MEPLLPDAYSRRRFLNTTLRASAAGAIAAPWLLGAAAPPSEADRAKIEAALPARARVSPKKPRNLLIFERNVNYGGHGSIPTASLAFTLMGQKTGAFKTVVTSDPEYFRADALRQFDAVFFNNNVGNLFEDPPLRQALANFIYSGGGLMGVHGTSVAFTKWPGAVEDWPEFGLMIGARGANHRASDERVVMKLDDPAHPVLAPFGGQSFEYRDEFFRVHAPYSRQRLRVLLSMDNEQTGVPQGPAYGQLVRADQDYAVAWVRQWGRGRSFYCTIAHNPSVFWDPKMLEFYLAAAQFALGDLVAPTTPSARLTPAVRAQETLGWRAGYFATPDQTLFEAIDGASAVGLLYLGANATQKVSAQIAKPFDAGLTDDERREIRFKLDAAGVRLLTYRVAELPADNTAGRKLFDFAWRMGCEAVIAPPPVDLTLAAQLGAQFQIKLAFDGSAFAFPDTLINQFIGFSPHVGAAVGPAVVGKWLRRTTRAHIVQLPLDPQLLPVALAEIKQLRTPPVMIGFAAGPKLAETKAAMDQECLYLSGAVPRPVSRRVE